MIQLAYGFILEVMEQATQWRYNYGFDIYKDDVYVADYYGHRILKLDASL